MEALSLGQYNLIYNLMSLTIATMAAAALFFFFSRQQVAPKYRPALLISGLVVAIACYHYIRIAGSFSAAYTFSDGSYVASGAVFNDAYRYADWVLTVPLLVIELVAVLALAKPQARNLMFKLGGAALVMIALGYPGEMASSAGARWGFWGASMLFWAYIMYVLFTEFSSAIERQPETARPLVKKARLLILLTWAFYPIAYLGPEFGLAGAGATTFVQVGYTIADITAKAGLGLYIYFIARAKSEADEYVPGRAAQRTLATES